MPLLLYVIRRGGCMATKKKTKAAIKAKAKATKAKAAKAVKKIKKAVKSTAKKVKNDAKKVIKNVKQTVQAFKTSGDIVLLLKQGVGKPCVPCVKKGDKVVVGQLIAKPQGLGANLHSSVDGVVTKVTDAAIFIKSNKILSSLGQIVPKTIKAKKDDMLACVTEAGIVGMGGAGFPTGVKLSTEVKDGYVLVNAVECEPILAHNMAQLVRYSNETIKGVHYVMKITKAKHGIIAIKQKHKEEIEAVLKALKGITDIHVHLLPDIYPMGEERAVVRECLGKLLDVNELPSAANAIVINVETVLRVYEAIEFGRPAVSKNLTVSGKIKGINNGVKVFYDVPIGLKVKDVIEAAGGIDGKYGEIIMGGPFMGKPCKLDDPITKTTGGIIVTEPFKDYKGAKVGLLVCACGANEDRLKDIASKYNMKVVDVEYCKQAKDPKGNGVYKCENPGNCPGQALKCMNIKKAGATEILISNCSDCTNTVMGSAPGLGLNVHHATDHIFETVGMEVQRHLKKSKFVEGPIPEGCTASRNPESNEPGGINSVSHAGGAGGVSADYSKPYVFREDSPEGEILISIESGSDISVKWED